MQLRAVTIALLLTCFSLSFTGCRSARYLSQRSARFNPLTETLALVKPTGPEISERTWSTLRRYGLEEQYNHHCRNCVDKIRLVCDQNPDPELIYALIELSYVEGKKSQQAGRDSDALNQYGLALTSSYDYLFSDQLDPVRNRYDPQFRAVCDLYNESLEDALRLLCKDNKLVPGKTYRIKTQHREFVVSTEMRGKWDPEEFESYEFVSDYEIETLRNKHTTYGLGVPLIAVRRPSKISDDREKYYPPDLSYAVTALIRCEQPKNQRSTNSTQCVLEFFDPLTSNQVQLSDHWVPLETDLTTPLAYLLDSPRFRERDIETAGLLNPAETQKHRGLFMLEPYDPNRIPVLMVHGLWSSPRTWMDMFNDLRSFPEIRERYQFWFYIYPSGQPFWISANQLRGDLAAMRNVVDPGQRHRPIDSMVLVGHSMGGLVSRMQTIDSGNDFWKIVSDQPVKDLNGPAFERNKLVSTLFFKPNRSVKRVITIGTPHRGSDFANDYTRWLARKIIKLPTMATMTGDRLARANPRLFRDTSLLTTANAIDSLAPESPIFPVMQRAKYASDVKFHNIIGVVEDPSFLQRRIGPGDGIVAYASAKMDDVESELVVNAEHTSVHMTGKAIYEVRRILMEHMAEYDSKDRIATRIDDWPFDDRQSGDSDVPSSEGLVPVTITR
ncbi:MAG: alpha/beta fold hydrolase [Pirellulaceae bacterium]